MADVINVSGIKRSSGTVNISIDISLIDYATRINRAGREYQRYSQDLDFLEAAALADLLRLGAEQAKREFAWIREQASATYDRGFEAGRQSRWGGTQSSESDSEPTQSLTLARARRALDGLGETWTQIDFARSLARSRNAAFRAVKALLANGDIEVVDPDPDWVGHGRQAFRYRTISTKAVPTDEATV